MNRIRKRKQNIITPLQTNKTKQTPTKKTQNIHTKEPQNKGKKKRGRKNQPQTPIKPWKNHPPKPKPKSLRPARPNPISWLGDIHLLWDAGSLVYWNCISLGSFQELESAHLPNFGRAGDSAWEGVGWAVCCMVKAKRTSVCQSWEENGGNCSFVPVLRDLSPSAMCKVLGKAVILGKAAG